MRFDPGVSTISIVRNLENLTRSIGNRQKVREGKERLHQERKKTKRCDFYSLNPPWFHRIEKGRSG